MKVMSALISALFLMACSNSSLPSKSGVSGVLKTDLVKYVGQTIPDRPKVSAFELDEIGMRVDAFRVGLFAFMQSDTPQVEFMIPEPADYIELLRCKEDATAIQGLLNVEMSVGSAAAVVRLMRETDFWQLAATSPSCLLLSPSVSKNGYFDASAPTGTWRYVARACVQQSRLIDTDILGTRNCSKIVGVSTSLRSYQNLRAARENAAMDEMRNALARADGMGRQIYFQTVEYNNALVACDKNKARNDAAQKRFSGIAQIIGAGVSLGATILSGSPANTTAETLWEKRDTIISGGSEIGGVLTSLFINPSNYITSCTLAEKIQDEIKLNALELKLVHQQYLGARVTATEAAAARSAVEK